jgi:hypothetical protein
VPFGAPKRPLESSEVIRQVEIKKGIGLSAARVATSEVGSPVFPVAAETPGSTGPGALPCEAACSAETKKGPS